MSNQKLAIMCFLIFPGFFMLNTFNSFEKHTVNWYGGLICGILCILLAGISFGILLSKTLK